MAKNIPLSSADLLTLQVLERELIDPTITKAYERELRARVEYLNASPMEKAKLRLAWPILDPLEEYYKK